METRVVCAESAEPREPGQSLEKSAVETGK